MLRAPGQVGLGRLEEEVIRHRRESKHPPSMLSHTPLKQLHPLILIHLDRVAQYLLGRPGQGDV